MNIETHPSSYASEKLEGRLRADGERGLFAVESIQKGELLAVFGGTPITYEQLMQLTPKQRSLCIQVAPDIYLFSTVESHADWVNHSCSPNAGLQGQIALVALRSIEPGEEIAFDYAMSDSTPYDEFECQCGSPDCRGYVSGKDWQLPELQRRYDGYFSSYLQKRIDDAKRMRTNGHRAG